MYLLQIDLHILVYLLQKCIRCWSLSAPVPVEKFHQPSLVCFCHPRMPLLHICYEAAKYEMIWNTDILEYIHIELFGTIFTNCITCECLNIFTSFRKAWCTSWVDKVQIMQSIEALLRRIEGQVRNGILSYHFN